MAFLKLFILYVLITMMDHHGIIYRTGKRKNTERHALTPEQERRGGIIHGSWRLSNAQASQPILIFPYEQPSAPEPSEPTELLVSFFPDSTFTQIGKNGKYAVGKWTYDSIAVSVFMNLGRSTEEVPLTFGEEPNGKRLMNFEFAPDQVLSMVENGEPIESFRRDPFHPANNLWRIKPEKPETDRQLLARLRNYIFHTACVLQVAQIRENRTVSLEFSEGIIRLYNVGIGIVKPDKIPASWLNAFYSREDAMKAYTMYEDFLFAEKIKSPQTGNWVRDDFDILIDIHNGLKNYKM